MVRLSAVRGVRMMMLATIAIFLRSTVHRPLLQLFTVSAAELTFTWRCHSHGTGHGNVTVTAAHQLTATAVVQQTASLAGGRLSSKFPTGRLTVEPPLGSLAREGRLGLGVHLG